MTSSEPQTPDRFAQRLDAFARILGPACESCLQGDQVRAEIRDRMDTGASLEDVVLGQLHQVIGRDRHVADEFAAYFIYDLMKMGKLSMSSSSRLRRFLDTGDLVLSVFGDLGGDLSSLCFETQSQFKSLFAQRLNWKASDEARKLQSKRRREDRRIAQQPDELGLRHVDADSEPVIRSIQKEEKERFLLLLLRLSSDRDRRLLTLDWKGESIESIADTMGLSYDAARKALGRAKEQARKLAQQPDDFPYERSRS